MQYNNISQVFIKSLILTFFIQIIPILNFTASAKKPQHRQHSSNQSNRNRSQSYSNVGLNYTQRINLVNLIRNNDSFLEPTIKANIYSQANSLPPGIQKKLARGKNLPSGIAKKVLLPKTVNTHLNLDTNNTVVVIGSSVVIVNPQNIILDILHSVL